MKTSKSELKSIEMKRYMNGCIDIRNMLEILFEYVFGVFVHALRPGMDTLGSLTICSLRSVATVSCCAAVGVYARRQGVVERGEG